MIPKLSAPLTKLIRTGEGVILFAFNTATVVLGAVGDVAPGVAVKYAAIFNAVAFASRQALKAAAVLKPVVGEPVAPAATQSTDEILAEIEAAAQAVQAFQAKPGTPADQITSGLAPGPPSTITVSTTGASIGPSVTP